MQQRSPQSELGACSKALCAQTARGGARTSGASNIMTHATGTRSRVLFRRFSARYFLRGPTGAKAGGSKPGHNRVPICLLVSAGRARARTPRPSPPCLPRPNGGTARTRSARHGQCPPRGPTAAAHRRRRRRAAHALVLFLAVYIYAYLSCFHRAIIPTRMHLIPFELRS